MRAHGGQPAVSDLDGPLLASHNAARHRELFRGRSFISVATGAVHVDEKDGEAVKIGDAKVPAGELSVSQCREDQFRKEWRNRR